MKESELQNKDVKHPGLASKIRNYQVVTTSIPQGSLRLYLDAGLATGFKVEEIADAGKKIPVLVNQPRFSYPYRKEDLERMEPRPEVQHEEVKKGYIAVAIEKPEDSKRGHNPFWEALETLKQNKVAQSLKVTVNS
ncbi:MAG: hypothetical protein Q7R31_03815 [Candidatus Levybacteria bacterium]|nr:hypothetical protein [Candidatus Levybacteria bacterium]